jgi:hypothetical protein
MSEPTIDEMLKVLDSIPETYLNDKEIEAIRAILEQHRDLAKHGYTQIPLEPMALKGQIGLEAIRAFVERVEKRPEHWKAAIMNELAAMEKETQEQ